MIKYSTLIIAIFIASLASAQNKMLVDEKYNGNIYYKGHSTFIDSTTELPQVIQFNVSKHLESMLGAVGREIKFSHGQIIDLETAFKVDSNHSGTWVRPKYDLNFVIKNESIGIKKYYLQLRLDMYGQLLFANWPRKNHSRDKDFKSRSDIRDFALGMAKFKGFELEGYKVDFKYNKQFDKLSWAFKFQSVENNYEYNALEISWNGMQIIEESDYFVE